MLVPLAALAALGALIWFLGSGRFGRAQTQGWIDRWTPPGGWARRTLNRHHGAIRAAAHYIEFGGLFLVLYWVAETLVGDGRWGFHPLRAVLIGLACMAAAFLDELHQLKSGTRQFRRVDFLHSTCGIAIAALIVAAQAWLRGVW